MKNSASVKDVIEFDGKMSGMDSYIPTRIVPINDDHLAVIVFGMADDDIRIFNKNGKCPSHEIVEEDHIKSIAVHKGIVYVGLQSGYLARVSVKSFLKGKFQKEMTRILVNMDRPITSMVFSDKYVVVSCQGSLHQYPQEFPKEDEKKRSENVKTQQLHHHQEITEILMLTDISVSDGNITTTNGFSSSTTRSATTTSTSTYFAARFKSLGEVHVVEFDTLRVVWKINLEAKIRALKSGCESLDCRATALLSIYDVLWIGTGSGHLFIYDVGRPDQKEPELLTVFEPYVVELRELCLWRIPESDKNIYNVEFLVVSTGKLMNKDAFGSYAACPLTNTFPPEDERSADKKMERSESSRPSVTSFDDKLKAPEGKTEGKTILFWYATDAETMRILLKET